MKTGARTFSHAHWRRQLIIEPVLLFIRLVGEIFVPIYGLEPFSDREGIRLRFKHHLCEEQSAVTARSVKRRNMQMSEKVRRGPGWG